MILGSYRYQPTGFMKTSSENENDKNTSIAEGLEVQAALK